MLNIAGGYKPSGQSPAFYFGGILEHVAQELFHYGCIEAKTQGTNKLLLQHVLGGILRNQDLKALFSGFQNPFLGCILRNEQFGVKSSNSAGAASTSDREESLSSAAGGGGVSASILDAVVEVVVIGPKEIELRTQHNIFQNEIIRVLSQVHPNVKIGRNSTTILSELIFNLFNRVVSASIASIQSSTRQMEEEKEAHGDMCIYEIPFDRNCNLESDNDINPLVVFDKPLPSSSLWSTLLPDEGARLGASCAAAVMVDDYKCDKEAFRSIISGQNMAPSWLNIKRIKRKDIRFISERGIQSGFSKVLDGELSKHALLEMTKACMKFDSNESQNTVGDVESRVNLSGGVGNSPTPLSFKEDLEHPDNFNKRCGLVFQPELTAYLTNEVFGIAISEKGAISLAAGLEYLTAEILELSGNVSKSGGYAMNGGYKRWPSRADDGLQPGDIRQALRDDVELVSIFPDINEIIKEAGIRAGWDESYSISQPNDTNFLLGDRKAIWSCPQCNLINESYVDFCIECIFDRQNAEDDMDGSDNEEVLFWRCFDCNTRNPSKTKSMKNLNCTACETFVDTEKNPHMKSAISRGGSSSADSTSKSALDKFSRNKAGGGGGRSKDTRKSVKFDDVDPDAGFALWMGQCELYEANIPQSPPKEPAKGYYASYSIRSDNLPDVLLHSCYKILKSTHDDVYAMEGVIAVAGLIELLGFKIARMAQDFCAKAGKIRVAPIHLEAVCKMLLPAMLSNAKINRSYMTGRYSRWGGGFGDDDDNDNEGGGEIGDDYDYDDE